ncbi:low molecular weight protein-tyrosine-phosphatase [Anaerosporobacter sp.]|uniref:low molecular weight protein-tyrosine-phosphatase n=1 Tax=Anaerosporobacter sp. TaxID=1872529 RepID=UPI00286FABB4|nr:low molecular weight protein-tyrosine-phosphatase [Anaerosporobacter sp.]
MIKVMFICHGNICRSPMAEFVLKDMVEKRGLKDEFHIVSSATSTEELGNPVHSGTRNVLKKKGISVEGKYAVRLQKNDYSNYDYFIGMDSANIHNIYKIFGGDNEGKVYKMLYFADASADVDDPWYTGDFETTYRDIYAGCEGFLEHLGM